MKRSHSQGMSNCFLWAKYIEADNNIEHILFSSHLFKMRSSEIVSCMIILLHLVLINFNHYSYNKTFLELR